MTVHYYSISFYYPGPRAGILTDSEDQMPAIEACLNAENKVEELLRKIPKTTMKHAYSWPDGSMSKYLKSEFSMREILEHTDVLFADSDIRVTGIGEPSPGSRPYKAGHETLKSYMDAVEIDGP